MRGVPCNGPKNHRVDVLQRLREISPNADVSCDQGSQFKICLRLKKQFCNEVIEFMKTLFEKMGITYVPTYHLQNFHITTNTYFRISGQYMDFAEYLRNKHKIIHYENPPRLIAMPNIVPLS